MHHTAQAECLSLPGSVERPVLRGQGNRNGHDVALNSAAVTPPPDPPRDPGSTRRASPSPSPKTPRVPAESGPAQERGSLSSRGTPGVNADSESFHTPTSESGTRMDIRDMSEGPRAPKCSLRGQKVQGRWRLVLSRSRCPEHGSVERQGFMSPLPATPGTKIQLSRRATHTPRSFSGQKQLWKRSETIKEAKCIWRGGSLGAGGPSLPRAAADKASAHSIRSRKMENS